MTDARYAEALALFEELGDLVEHGNYPGNLQVALVNTRAVAGAILAVAEALHARDTLAGSTDE